MKKSIFRTIATGAIAALAFIVCDGDGNVGGTNSNVNWFLGYHGIQCTLIDSRDGQTYRTVVIGSLTWMAENLNHTTSDSWCYDNAEINCNTYGRLYTWNAALIACPAGWRLPTRADWDDLVFAAGGRRVAGRNLKSQTGWSSSSGIDAHGFSALPGGLRGYDDGLFSFVGWYGYWWSATEDVGNAAWHRHMTYDDVGESICPKAIGLSVRCARRD